jgi:YVTN family beta-propeller protein
MIRRQRDQQVEARAALILDGGLAIQAYADYFETQMRGSRLRRLLSPRRVSRTGVLVVAGLLAASVLLGTAAAHVAQGMLAGANELVALDSTSGAEVGRIPVDGEPGGIVSGGGSIWVASAARGTVTRIDPATQSVTQTIRLPAAALAHLGPLDPLGPIAFGAGGLWVADPAGRRLFELDPATGALERTLPTDLAPVAIAATATALWVAGRDSTTVESLAPASGRVIARVRVGDGPSALALDAGSLWVASSVAGTVSRIDLATSAVTATVPVGSGPAALAAGAGSVWVADKSSGTIARIDPARDRVAAWVGIAGFPTSLTVSGSYVWVGVQRTAATVG